jgi:hypothetical protein
MGVAVQQRRCARVGKFFIGLEFASSRRGQDRDAAAGIVGMGPGSDKPFLLEASKHAAHQAGIQAEVIADISYVGAAPADRIQDACGPERPAPTEERGVQGADFEGDGRARNGETGSRDH